MAGAAQTFVQLRTRAAALVELAGFTDTANTPDYSVLVNRAYDEFCWETECNLTSDATLTTVADQAEYTIPLPHFRTIYEVLYDGYPLSRTSLAAVRESDPEWLTAASGTPDRYWRPKWSTLRLYVPPETASKTLTIYGSRSPADLSADGDCPDIPNAHHDGLAQRAAWLAMEAWVRGEERQALQDRIDQYLAGLRRMRAQQHQDVLAGVGVYRAVPATERVSI